MVDDCDVDVVVFVGRLISGSSQFSQPEKPAIAREILYPVEGSGREIWCLVVGDGWFALCV